MSLGRAWLLPHGLGLGARLAALSLLAFTVTVAAGAFALITIRGLDADHTEFLRLDGLADQAMSIDQLNNSLTADVYARYAGLNQPVHRSTDEVRDLQKAALGLADGGHGEALRQLGVAEYQFAERAHELLSAPTVARADAEAFLIQAEDLSVQGAEQRRTLELARDRLADQQKSAVGAALIEVSAGALLAGGLLFGVGWRIRRRLLANLSELSTVARAVAHGDLAARVGFCGRDEVGDLARVLDEMAAALQRAFHELDADALRQDFRSRLDRALNQSDDDSMLSSAVGLVLATIAPQAPSELLLADSSEAHLSRFAENPRTDPPRCPVTLPWSCPAVRAGRATVFDSSEQIDSCAHLRGRTEGVRAGVCIPVSFMGRVLGVLHTATDPPELPDDDCQSRLRDLAEQCGSRLGTMRAFDRVQRQARMDGLTGLANRRAFEDSVRQLEQAEEPYAVLLADLDRFKSVNDTYGHSAGDRALRVFADVLRSGLRGQDLVCRYGGEEFALALPGQNAEEAAAVADRLRAKLATALSGGQGPVFTVSFGAADSLMAGPLAAQLELADAALLLAKRSGRDRCVVATSESAMPPLLPSAREPADQADR